MGRPTERTPLFGEKHRRESRYGDLYVGPRNSGARVFLLAVVAVHALVILGFFLSFLDFGIADGVTRRIAIVGAGPSGASVAYHLVEAMPSGHYMRSDKLEITVFERSPRVGGRCMFVQVPSFGNVELGAPGYNTVTDPAVAEIVEGLGLMVIPGGQWGPVEGDFEIGIFDGAHLRYRQPHNAYGIWKWWTNLTYFLRYGWSHKNLQGLTSRVFPVWSSYVSALSRTDGPSWRFVPSGIYKPPFTFSTPLRSALSTSAIPYLSDNNIKDPFTTEQIGSRARARYGANLGALSGMHALRVMEDAEQERQRNVRVLSGLEAVFRWMLSRAAQHAGARGRGSVEVRLNTTVYGFRKNETVEEGKEGQKRTFHGWTVGVGNETDLLLEDFDDVVVAGPWKGLGKVINEPVIEMPEVSWESMYVTVFMSPRKLAPEAFGLGRGDYRGMPPRVYSTLSDRERNLENASGEAGVGQVGWWSVETVGSVPKVVKPAPSYPAAVEQIGSNDANDPDGIHQKEIRWEYVYKILSPRELSNATIMDMLRTQSEDDITWIHRHFWEFAFQTPTTSSFTEDAIGINLDAGLWYTGGMDGALGGVEGAVIMGKRVADEIVGEWRRGNTREKWKYDGHDEPFP